MAGPPALDKEAVLKSVLECHNCVRGNHDVPPVTLNKELSAHAQKWADHIVDDLDGKLKHSDCKYKGKTVGENIAMGNGLHWRKDAGKEACKLWYSEIQYYKLNKPGHSDGTAHFTQMVWKSTTEIGVGVALRKGGSYYIVCNYNPPGNYVNKYPENVLPKKK